MYLLLMVLDNPDYLEQVLKAWQTAGIHGITILESTGLNRVITRHKARPAFVGFGQLFGSGRAGNQTLMALVPDMAIADGAIAASEKIIGNLNQPNTGIAFMAPVVKSWGLDKAKG